MEIPQNKRADPHGNRAGSSSFPPANIPMAAPTRGACAVANVTWCPCGVVATRCESSATPNHRTPLPGRHCRRRDPLPDGTCGMIEATASPGRDLHTRVRVSHSPNAHLTGEGLGRSPGHIRECEPCLRRLAHAGASHASLATYFFNARRQLSIDAHVYAPDRSCSPASPPTRRGCSSCRHANRP